MQDYSRIFCEVSISNLHHYDIYLVLAASEGEYDPQSSQGSHRKTQRRKLAHQAWGRSCGSPIPWPGHGNRIVSPECHQVFWCFGWSQVLVPDAAGRGSRRIQFGETFAALQFFTWLPGDKQPAARLTAARLDPRLESILVGISFVQESNKPGGFCHPQHRIIGSYGTRPGRRIVSRSVPYLRSLPWVSVAKGRSGWSRSACQSHEAEHWGVVVIWCCF